MRHLNICSGCCRKMHNVKQDDIIATMLSLKVLEFHLFSGQYHHTLLNVKQARSAKQLICDCEKGFWGSTNSAEGQPVQHNLLNSRKKNKAPRQTCISFKGKVNIVLKNYHGLGCLMKGSLRDHTNQMAS